MLETLSQEKKIFSMTWKDLGITSLNLSDQLKSFEEKNGPHVTVPIPNAGFTKAYETLLNFDQKISNYKADRDMPDIPGTSRLSIYFKNGSLTTSQVLYAVRNTFKPRNDEGTSTYIKEIIWREFYYHILFHCPNVETEAFLPQFRYIKWENREDYFERWKTGKTGFPIVDAGMRQLKQTGWMHNRVRMIVGSFLVKDLLIDWRWGENHFMKELLDGDLAPNNGGWQWVASTGCDPQPYFRIFNPWLQSQKFDPDGNYIRKYVPELAKAPTSALHKPEADRTVWNYPRPIVEHDQQKKRALLLYKS
jgi:deoxyribodipyrimidine photo-lyase